jgi:hypothetical protein
LSKTAFRQCRFGQAANSRSPSRPERIVTGNPQNAMFEHVPCLRSQSSRLSASWTGCDRCHRPRFAITAAANANQGVGLWKTGRKRLFRTGMGLERCFALSLVLVANLSSLSPDDRWIDVQERRKKVCTGRNCGSTPVQSAIWKSGRENGVTGKSVRRSAVRYLQNIGR